MEKNQKHNLELLWQKIIETSSNRPQSSKLPKSKFPSQWILNDPRHFEFAQKIVQEYKKNLATNYKKDMQMSETILPFPKDIIKKAIYFIVDHLYFKNLLSEMPDKENFAINSQLLGYILDKNFVDISKKKKNYKKEKDLLLIDWRSDLEWIAEGIRAGAKNFNDGENIGYALACIEEAKKINPNRKDIKETEGILHLTIAEYYKEIGDNKLAYIHIKKSVSLNNKEAKKSIRNYYS